MIQFDEHIFQMGWNHHLVIVERIASLNVVGVQDVLSCDI